MRASSARRAGRRDSVSTWLPVAVIAAAEIILRLISVAGVIWRERARATSHCSQMETAASSGAMLGERLRDGSTLLIVPVTQAPPGKPSP
jgi:hypothetical protein